VTSLPRRPKHTPTPGPAIPSDLAKPRDLAATIYHGPSVESPLSQKHKANGVGQNERSLSVAHGDVPGIQEPPTGQKRPATGDNISQLPVHPSTSNGEKAKGHPPPTKRPKKEKTSIFMPKKPNKVGPVP
jgi:hypothetical protein